MPDMIESSNIKGTVLTSRNFQEAFRIQEGESRYAVLARCMEVNQQQIDAFARFCGSATGYLVMEHRRQEIYHAEKNGKFTNWINRNIYQAPVKTNTRHAKEVIGGTIASMVTEWLVKQAAEGVFNYVTKKANYQAVEQVYSFLQNYAMTDAHSSNQKRAQLELAKI